MTKNYTEYEQDTEEKDYLGLMHLLEDLEGQKENNQDENLYNKIARTNLKMYETNEEFNDHRKTIRDYIIEEYKNKLFYRKFSFWFLIGVASTLLLFIYGFMFLKSDSQPLALLITLTISVFANFMGLIGIMFKYVFSSTTELTDYAKVLTEQKQENNKN